MSGRFARRGLWRLILSEIYFGGHTKVNGHGRMAYPKHTLFYSAVLDQVQTRSVVCCGFRYCGVRHNPLQFTETHSSTCQKMGIKSNLNHSKQRQQSHAMQTIHTGYFHGILSDGNAREGKMRFTIIMTLLSWTPARLTCMILIPHTQLPQVTRTPALH